MTGPSCLPFAVHSGVFFEDLLLRPVRSPSPITTHISATNSGLFPQSPEWAALRLEDVGDATQPLVSQPRRQGNSGEC